MNFNICFECLTPFRPIEFSKKLNTVQLSEDDLLLDIISKKLCSFL